jgi:hypothetical protein
MWPVVVADHQIPPNFKLSGQMNLSYIIIGDSQQRAEAVDLEHGEQL